MVMLITMLFRNTEYMFEVNMNLSKIHCGLLQISYRVCFRIRGIRATKRDFNVRSHSRKTS